MHKTILMAAELPLTEKQVKKLKKILGEDLYAQWRAAHPQEAPKLPDLPAFENQ